MELVEGVKASLQGTDIFCMLDVSLHVTNGFKGDFFSWTAGSTFVESGALLGGHRQEAKTIQCQNHLH